MEIVNLDKIAHHKRIVMTGRDEHVCAVSRALGVNPFSHLLYYPGVDDYFMDYPILVNNLCDALEDEDDVVVIVTQNKEFLDCLLTSNIDFIFVTVRKFDHDPADTYRLRVLTKEEAWADRRDFNMELRI